MSDDPVIEALNDAIERKQEELQRLLDARVEYGRRRIKKRSGRTRRRGFRPNSLPGMVADILKKSDHPLTSAEIVIALKARGRDATTRIISASLSRYVKVGVFRRTEDGRYELLEK